ncbi:hypothetical protein ACFYQA_08450 [Streptomyces sp. NPDC005774]|uniref:hypothetical protein n=1 Tax=Streptomyces sp. NPDC005774 TaxID=3364728 RepID=UPI003680263C
MTNQQPYTNDDLRAEASRQHAILTEDPDYVGVGEQMEDAWVPSVETTEDGSARTWRQLLVIEKDDEDDEDYTAYGEAQEKIHGLINGAADVSEWAVNLGADGLQPDAHQLTWSAGEQPIVRVHFAFHPDMHDEARDYLVTAVGEALHEQMQRAATVPAAEEKPAGACGQCRQSFDPSDTRFDGKAQQTGTPYCRGCVDRCHESTDAFHVCAICR